MGSETNINTFIKWTNFEIELNEKFYNARDFVHNALCGKKVFINYIYIYLYDIFRRSILRFKTNIKIINL